MSRCLSTIALILFLTSTVYSQGVQGAPPPGTISGTVTNMVTTQKLQGVSVEAWTTTGRPLIAGTALTDALGVYHVTGLDDGDYHVRTRTGSNFIDEYYNNQPCPGGSCGGAAPTTVTVSGGGITGIDFALFLGGSISGAVTDVDIASPMAGVKVNVYDTSGTFVNFVTTDGSGAYSIEQLPAGIYRLRTQSTTGHADELYNDISCVDGNCDVSTGTEISVTADANTANINFALEFGGSISGTVTLSAGSFSAGWLVLVYDSDGTLAGTGVISAADGTYQVTRLPAGIYTARTETSLNYQDELYDGPSCPNGLCDVTLGDPITVLTGATTAGIDFVLSHVGKVSGYVDSPDGWLQGVEVRLYYPGSGPLLQRNLLDTDITDASGKYVLGGASLREAVVVTSNAFGYVDELYNDVACPGATCDTTFHYDFYFDLSNGANETANFYLEVGGGISGTVTKEATGAPIEGIEVNVYGPGPSASDKFWFASAQTDVTGAYSVTGLPSETGMRVETLNTGGYVDEVYDDRWCVVGDCPIHVDQVFVTLGVETPGIDFALDRGGQISGRVTDGATGLPIESAQVEVDNSGGTSVPGGYPTVILTTDAAGDYISPLLPPGTYTVNTYQQYRDGYSDEIWDDIQCGSSPCDYADGTPIPVEADLVTTGIDFELWYGAIGGTVTDAITDLPITSGFVRVVDTSGSVSAQGSIDSQGAYLIEGLAAGSYYVWTFNGSDHIDEVYDDLICLNPAQCDKTVGTPVIVGGGTATIGIDFELTRYGTISGELTNQASSEAVRGNVYIYDSAGDFVRSSGSVMGPYEVTKLPPGNYTAKVIAPAPLHNELYNDLPCEAGCDVTNGSPIAVTAGAETTGIDFALEAKFSIGGNVTGLAGMGLILQNNAGDDLVTDANGPFNFATSLKDGSSYAVTVLAQPTSPAQTCSVTNGSGTVNGIDITDVTVNCTLSSDSIFGNGFEN